MSAGAPVTRPPPRLAQNLVVLVISCALALGASEVGLRLVYRAPWYMQLLGEKQRSQQLPYRLNALGLRDRDYPSAKPTGTRRIFIIGDSFTFGLGVPDDSAVMPELLEQMLNQEGGHVEVLNGGIPASLTGDWVRLLDRAYRSFNPDLVLIVFFLRDGTRTAAMSSFFKPIRTQIAERNRDSWTYRYSYLYRVVRDYRDRQHVADLYSARLTSGYSGTPAQTEEWQAARRNLLTIARFARDHGARTAMAVYPILVDLKGPYLFQAICDTVQAFAVSHGIPVHNLIDDFRGQDAPALWVSPFDQHPNERGHAIAANGLLPFVRELLDAPTPVTDARAHR